MEHNLFKYLPSEIIINILSRLHVRTIATIKCVCKSWLDLLETDDFVNSHFAKSVPSLAMSIPEKESNWLNVVEFDDEADVHPLTSFAFPHRATMAGSANGFLFLEKYNENVDVLYICNPITRKFIELSYSRESAVRDFTETLIYGFGTSKIGGEHKVIRIFHKGVSELGLVEYRVYTLGTGLWRSVAAPAELDYSFSSFGAFVNGNLYWIVSDSNGTTCVSCFDLETECFTTFRAPPPLPESGVIIVELTVLNDRLCLCDNELDDEIVIWLMKECGVEKSWSKEYVIPKNPNVVRMGGELIYPIKSLEDGHLLLSWDGKFLLYFCNKTKTTHQIGLFQARRGQINSVLLTPSFLSLKSFEMENAISI